MKKTGTALLLTMGLIFTTCAAPLTEDSILVASASSGISIFAAAREGSSSDASEDSDTQTQSDEIVIIIGEDVEEDALSDVEEADGAVLPDVGVFLNCARGEDMEYRSYGHLISYSFDLDNGSAAVAEVIDLLQEPQYELSLVNTKENDYISSSGLLVQYYEFSYTGTEDVPSVTDDNIYGSSYDVLVQANYYYSGSGRTGLAIYYSNGFTLTEPDTVAETQPDDYSGTGSNSGSTDYDTDTDDNDTGVTIKCTKCHGEGTIACTNCDGLGYKIVYIQTPNYSGHSDTSSESKETCYKCHGSGTITCTRCGGSGVQ
ncbi:MAG: hypothetical protein LUI14_12640 [Lachnospiraceae bacterium]|nr:hypothetical protein [Lachnospiraceae bacterium]MCD7765206.1 hypothetical protein [Lachnospiraceae bacterium]